MKIFLIVIAAVAALVVIYLLLMLAFAIFIVKASFGRRCDKNPLLKYFSAEDFNLDTQPVETMVKNQVIRGYIYTKQPLESCKTLVIFAHGMGPGQCAYTTEIAYFCGNGCAVLAFDCLGCGISEGKSAGGLEMGTRCLVAAAEYAFSQSCFKNKKIILAGHSMGAYSALCASQFVKADGVVAFAAPENASLVYNSQAKAALGKAGKFFLLKPFLILVNKAKHGKYGEIKTSQAVQKSGVKALVIQGENDPVVRENVSAYGCCNGKNVTKLLCKGKKHNPYNTINAESKLAELQKGLADSKNMTEEERDKFFSSRDYNAICEEDQQVMSAAMDFINSL